MTARSATRPRARRRSASGARPIARAPLHTAVKVAAVALAVLVAFVPRRRGPLQVAALGAAVLVAVQLAATHWFYLYVVWFAPLALVALLGPLSRARRPAPSRWRTRARPVGVPTRAPRAGAGLRRAALACWAPRSPSRSLPGPWGDERVSDLFVYRENADGIPRRLAALPRRGVRVSAAGGAAAWRCRAWRARRRMTYRLAFGVARAGAGRRAVVLLIGALAERTGGDRRTAMIAAALMPLLTGAMIRTHFDLAPVALTLARAPADLRAAGSAWASPCSGLGGDDEGVPAGGGAASRWRGSSRAASGARRSAARSRSCSRAGAIAAAAVALSPSGALDAVTYHLDRPVQLESSPASRAARARRAWASERPARCTATARTGS